MSEVLALETDAEEIAAWAADAPLTEGILTPFGVLDPEQLSIDGCLNMLVGLERLKAWCDAQQARYLARMAARPDPVPAPPGPLADADQLSVRQEIACALRWSFCTASERVDAATALAERFRETLAGLEEGRFSYSHVRALTRATRELDSDAARSVEAQVLQRAGSQTPAEFSTAVRRAVATADPRGEAEQHRAAAEERRVAVQPDEYAMAWLHAYLPAADAQTVWQAIDATASLVGNDPTDSRTADQRRADALAAICQATLDGRVVGPVGRWHGTKPAVNVTVALSTLLGLDEQPGHLDGYGPIPAQVAVTLAGNPESTWRRLVTDEYGRLLDYGRTTYRPPQDLTDFVTARDGTCRAPGCGRLARRCELDHITDWHDGGTTSPDNLEPKCRRDHHLKHDCGWAVARTPDGTTQWISPTARQYEKPPHTYPVDTTRPRTEPDPDPPPL